jgi:hypothetical protein
MINLLWARSNHSNKYENKIGLYPAPTALLWLWWTSDEQTQKYSFICAWSSCPIGNMQHNLQIEVKYGSVAHLGNEVWDKHNKYSKSECKLAKIEQPKISCLVRWNTSSRPEYIILSQKFTGVPEHKHLDTLHILLKTASFSSAILSHVMHMWSTIKSSLMLYSPTKLKVKQYAYVLEFKY